jgi:hypothetical protein
MVRKKQEYSKELGIENKHPLLLIRYGYANKMPYSLRRSFEEVYDDGVRVSEDIQAL